MDIILAFLAGVLVGWISLVDPAVDVGYKRGQIDAITGNIKYELVVHPDKTTTWEEKK